MFLNVFPKRNTSHTSYWMSPTAIDFIKRCSETTRMPQGLVLEIIITDYRLRRKADQLKRQGLELNEADKRAREAVDYYFRILPY